MKKKIPKTSELMWILGIIFVALGVTICKKADLGVSMIAAPAFIVYEALAPLWSGFSVGMVEYAIQGLVLVLMCVIIRKFDWRFLLAFVSAIIYGYVLDLCILIIGTEPFSEIYVRWIMLIVGDCTTALGVACFFRTYLPLQVYELFVAQTAKKFKVKIATVKWGFDISCLALSIILSFSLFGDVKSFPWQDVWKTSFHSIGLGTVITTIINAPIINFWSKLLSKTCEEAPLIPKLHAFFCPPTHPNNEEANKEKEEINKEREEIS